MEQFAEMPPEMPAVWHVAIGEEKRGPLTMAQVTQLFDERLINSRSMVWQKGMTGWQAAGQVPELASLAFSSRVASLAKDERLQQALEIGKESSKNAIRAFFSFIVNPLGGLPGAYESLGKSGATSAGIVFFIIFEVLLLVGLRVTSWPGSGLDTILKILVCGAVPFASLMLGLFIVRNIVKSGESWHADLFVAGSYHVIVALGLCVSSFLGTGNVEVVILILLFTGYYSVFVLLSGLTRIYKAHDALATFVLPLIQVLSFWLTKVAVMAMFKDSFGGFISQDLFR